MNVIERRLEILRIMNAKRKSSVAKLAKSLNVSTRTIQRDIQSLMTIVPLVCISGNGGGIQLLDGYHLHSNIFTKEEVDVVKSVMTYANEHEKKILTEMLETYASCYCPKKIHNQKGK